MSCQMRTCVCFLRSPCAGNSVRSADFTVFQCFSAAMFLPPRHRGRGLGTFLVITAGAGLFLAASAHPRDPPDPNVPSAEAKTVKILLSSFYFLSYSDYHRMGSLVCVLDPQLLAESRAIPGSTLWMHR